MRYFKKELPDNPVYCLGQPFRFDFLATEDAVLISELDKCIRKQMGGVIAITKEEYEEELKKKEASPQFGGSSNGSPLRRQEIVAAQFRHLNLGVGQDGRRVAAVVANPSSNRRGLLAQQALPQREAAQAPTMAQMPDPIQIPTPAQFAKPPTAKVGDLK